MDVKVLQRCLIVIMVMTIAGVMTCVDSFAYFQRGNVNVYAGRNNVSLAQGSSASVSISFSPSSSRQLPGCGMAECPQICGEKNCLDANGECMCAGTTYQTYYPSASVYSSNTSVATASYSGGAVYIRGVSPGTATVTVSASLRQHTSTSTSIYVTVTRAASTSSGSSGTSSSSRQSGQVSAKAVDEATTEGKDRNKSETEASSTIESERGTITFVQIPDGATGKAALESIMGKKEYVDFQKEDDAGTILYSWEFFGEDVEEARDMDLNLDFSREAFEGCSYGTENNSVYITRGDEERLPAKATTDILITEWFDDSDEIYLYSFDGNQVSLLEEKLIPENGYVTCSTMYGEPTQYILSTERWDVSQAEVEEDDGNIVAWVAGIVIAAAAIAAIAVAIVKHGRKKAIEEMDE